MAAARIPIPENISNLHMGEEEVRARSIAVIEADSIFAMPRPD